MFPDKKWKRWGRFSSAPSKDAEDSPTAGVLGGFSCIFSRGKKVAAGGMLFSISQKKTAASSTERINQNYTKKDKFEREVPINA